MIVHRLAETARDTTSSDARYGPNGIFRFGKNQFFDRHILCIASNGGGWDHVSVSINANPNKLPTWSEMAQVKKMFWDGDQTVVQFHPREAEYVNCHPGVLHLWMKQGVKYELPPREMIA